MEISSKSSHDWMLFHHSQRTKRNSKHWTQPKSHTLASSFFIHYCSLKGRGIGLLSSDGQFTKEDKKLCRSRSIVIHDILLIFHCNYDCIFHCFWCYSSVLWRCWLGGRKGIRPVKKLSGGMLAWLCLCQGADFHTAQLMPLPLTISCSSKSRLVLPFWCRLTRIVPDKIQDGRKMVVCARAHANDVILLFYFVIAWTFFSVQKSLGGNILGPVTLEHYKLIKC